VAVSIPPSPGAVKFMGTMSTVGKELSTLQADDVSDGLYEYAQQYKTSMLTNFGDFKGHALDLGVVAFADEPEGGSRRSALSKAVSGRELVKLPIAGIYAVLALLFVVMFGVVHLPKKYGPIAYAKAKDKMVEYKVYEKMAEAKSAAVEKIRPTLAQAKESPQLAMVQEKLKVAQEKAGSAYAAAASSAAAAKMAEYSEQLRGKIGSELVKLREQRRSTDVLPQ